MHVDFKYADKFIENQTRKSLSEAICYLQFLLNFYLLISQKYLFFENPNFNFKILKIKQGEFHIFFQVPFKVEHVVYFLQKNGLKNLEKFDRLQWAQEGFYDSLFRSRRKMP